MTHQAAESSERVVLTAEDIEAAYERALSAMDAVENAVEHLTASTDDEATDSSAEMKSPRESREPSGGYIGPAVREEAPLLHPREIIEAALFVGGQSLTTKRLSQMLGGSETPERIDAHIEELNVLYGDEARPYQIDFGEGGYRLVLRQEFSGVRDAVFGAGPRDVKLSQDALEVLAFVAYRQPTTQEDLEAAGREQAGRLLRQLLRRQLIALERDTAGSVMYATTPRFLDVFGLRSLDELPFPEDLEFK